MTREGHARVPQQHIEDGLNLGIAVSLWRKAYREGTLSPEVIARLEGFPGWVWDPLAKREEEKFRALDAYVAREGNARVPQHHVEAGVFLGRSVAVWRKYFRNGGLRADTVKRLEAYPGWSWEPRSDFEEEKFAALDAYVAREGNSLVPAKHLEAGLSLGGAVHNWRQAYKKEGLAPELIQRLESYPGWTWAIRTSAERE